jgi:hypothetical protein
MSSHLLACLLCEQVGHVHCIKQSRQYDVEHVLAEITVFVLFYVDKTQYTIQCVMRLT